jgi:diguanylate cyclase (GGDEF)-like protein/PAS domain S-box-containing protein
VRQALTRSRALTRDNLEQQQRLDTLEELLEERLRRLAVTAELVRQGQVDSAMKLVRTAEHDDNVAATDGVLSRLAAAEHGLLRQRIDTHMFHADRARLYLAGTLLASIVLVAIGTTRLRKAETSARRLAAEADSAAQAARAAELALRDSEATARRNEGRFRAALDAMVDAFLIARPAEPDDGTVDAEPDLEIVEANEAAATLFGVTRDKLVGAQLGRLTPTPHTAAVRDAAIRVLRTGELHVGELSPEPGSKAPVWIRLQVARTSEGVAVSGHDISPSKRAEAALAEMAWHDELTGLLNRRGFRQLAEQEMSVARRAGRADLVVALDLVGFKAINDSYGHAEGDAALREVARVLRTTLRESDILARLGGDEFVIYAPNGGEDHTALVARLGEVFAAANAGAVRAGRPYALRTGIGHAVLRPGDDLDALLAKADRSLYESKAAAGGERRRG